MAAGQWWSPCGQLNQGDAYRPDVGGIVVPAQHLRDSSSKTAFEVGVKLWPVV
jgi:hypothetical protein